VWFTGSSNIRSYTCDAKQVYVSAQAAPEEFARTKEDGVPAVRIAALSVPVRSLDCGIAKQNRDLYETVDAEHHPDISFTLNYYKLESVAPVRRVRINGSLRIAGVERDYIVNGTVAPGPDGGWILRGDRSLNVRDFGIKPPRRFLGILRVRDEITVHFELVVRPLIDPLNVLATSLQ
jgi:hypothetical protein